MFDSRIFTPACQQVTFALRCVSDADSQGMTIGAEPQAAPQATRSRGESVRYVHDARRAARGRADVAQGQNSWAALLARTAAVHCDEMLICLAFCTPLQFDHRSFICPCAHAESSMYACIGLRIAAVSRSESVARVRFCCMLRLLAWKVPAAACAELGSILDPENDLWRFGHARVDRITVV